MDKYNSNALIFSHFAGSNGFSGTLPSEIGLLTNLTDLELGKFTDCFLSRSKRRHRICSHASNLIVL